ncbi:glycoside hydrolase family 71/99 protein [Flammeovirga aprica]|uniref:Uncharacterized protein n=1 Tax=Flammeovirga aprica JL-4 TaxID=694437 RepID=A0A7X9XD23_9BACT|nr:hypothetical protein [Flammeovirga aprica]NME72446.1 hypothetical protein [Flammeovirga aprica JL-4]
MKYRNLMIILCLHLLLTNISYGGDKHGESSRYLSYHSLVMTGYQGWFHVPGDENNNKSWVHWGHGGKFDAQNCTIDLIPDTREYKKTYDTPLEFENGEKVKLFSSSDKSTTDVHFKWMRQYGIDGAFMGDGYFRLI